MLGQVIVEPEFNSLPNGFAPMLTRCGIDRCAPNGVPEAYSGLYDVGAVYSATDSGDCTFSEVYSAGARIEALGLTVLTDDKEFFPAYNAAPVFNSQIIAQFPELEKIFEPISPLLTDYVMRSLNLQVDVDGPDPADVVFDWMVAERFITATTAP